MRFSQLFLASLGLVAASADPTVGDRSSNGSPIERRQSRPTSYAIHTIDQPIDHFPNSSKYAPHTKDTFKQAYVFDDTYYKPGGPVFLYIGGETSVQSRFSNLETGIIQIMMQEFNGLGVILENRYYGQSYPFANSTTDNLAYLTTEQTIADNRYFALNAKFPGVPNGDKLNAPGTPWVMYGGSLAGAQTAFTIKAHGDVLYGGIAASGTIKALLEYPQWYNPIQRLGPQDCISSINGIIDKFDNLVAAKNDGAVQQFKEIFGLGALKDNRDFAMTIAFPLGGPMNYPTNTWQELNWNPKVGSPDFFDFCRNVTDLNANKTTIAVDSILSNYTNGEPWTNLGNYAAYVKRVLLPLCPSGDYNNVECFGTQNQTFYADVTNSANRAYLYSTCSESGAYQVAPKSGPSLISRVLQKDYTQQWCTWAFPKGKYNKIPSTPDLNSYERYGGFNFTADRLAFVDGSSDVWNDLCYHSSLAPSPRISSDLHPELSINGGGHHWDSYGILDVAAEPQFIREAHYFEIRAVTRWLRNFKSWKPTQTFSG